MAKIIYYGCWDNNLGLELQPLREHFIDGVFKSSEDKPVILSCPAFKNYIKNVFIVKSTYHYTIEWDGKNITSPMYNQRFYDENITARNTSSGVLSYKSPSLVFTTEEKSLCISQEFAYFHDNSITRKLFTFPGKFNIGKHLPRNLELSAKFKEPGCVKINEGDALYYVRFHTEDDIIFKKFIITDEIKDIITSNLNIRKYTKGFKSLEWWYDLVARHNLKNYIVKRIKQNLL